MKKTHRTSPVHKVMDIIAKEIKEGNEITLDTAQRSKIYKELANNEAEEKHIKRALEKISSVYAISRVNDDKGKLASYDVNLIPSDIPDNAILSIEQLRLLFAVLIDSDYSKKHLAMDDFEDLLHTLLIASYGLKIDYDNLEMPDIEMIYSISIGSFSTLPAGQMLLRNRYSAEVKTITPIEVKIEDNTLFLGVLYDGNPRKYWFNLSKKWEPISESSLDSDLRE